MYPFLFAAFMTGSIYLLHSWGQCKQKRHVYLILYIGLVAIDFIFDHTFHAVQEEYNLKTHLLKQEEHEKKEEKKKLTRREIHEQFLAVCRE
jgi:hypothetical protein